MPRPVGRRQPSSLCHCRVGAKPPGFKLVPQNIIFFCPCLMVFQHITYFKGDVSEAKKMIAAAAEAGADCVKFQKSCLKVRFWRYCLRQGIFLATSILQIRVVITKQEHIRNIKIVRLIYVIFLPKQ